MECKKNEWIRVWYDTSFPIDGNAVNWDDLFPNDKDFIKSGSRDISGTLKVDWGCDEKGKFIHMIHNVGIYSRRYKDNWKIVAIWREKNDRDNKH